MQNANVKEIKISLIKYRKLNILFIIYIIYIFFLTVWEFSYSSWSVVNNRDAFKAFFIQTILCCIVNTFDLPSLDFAATLPGLNSSWHISESLKIHISYILAKMKHNETKNESFYVGQIKFKLTYIWLVFALLFLKGYFVKIQMFCSLVGYLQLWSAD